MSKDQMDEEARFVQAIEAAEKPPADPPPEPAPEPEAPKNPPTEAGSSVSGPANSVEDVESLPQWARDRLSKLESDRLAAIGQVAPTQRRLRELEHQLQHSRSAPASTPAAPPAPQQHRTESQQGGSTDPYLDSDEWKQYEREYPEEAKAIRKTIEAAFARADHVERTASERIKQIEERFGSFESFVHQQQVAQEIGALERAHPDWRELVYPKAAEDAVSIGTRPDGSPFVVTRKFGEWLTNEHPVVRALFFSDSAADNIYLMDKFKHATAPAPSAPAAQPQRRSAAIDIDPSPRSRQSTPVARATSMDPEEQAYLEAIAASAIR